MRKLTSLALALGMSVCAFAQKDSVNLDNVVVTGTRSATTARNLPVTVSIVDRQTLTENERISVLPTLTEQVPGLFITQRGMMGYAVSTGAAGGMSLRGISGGTGQMLVLIDGHPQYNGIYGHPIADAYQTMIADRVEVVRGPASVLYGGNAMGGVINIITRKSKQDGIHTHINLGAGSWGSVQAEASNQIRKGGFSSTVAGQYSRSDNHQPRMGFEQFGGIVKLGYDFSEYWSAFGDVNITHFNSTNPTRSEVKNGKLQVSDLFDSDQHITRGVVNVGLENSYKNSNGRVSFYYNWGKHEINDGYGPQYHNNKPQTTLFNSEDALIGFSAYQSTKFFEGNNVTLGVDYQHIIANAYYTDIKTGAIQPSTKACTDEQVDEFAAYIDVRQDITSWVTVDAGIRYDYHQKAMQELVPQAGIVFKPLKNGELRVTASKGFRNPTPKDMFLYGMANEELRAERMWNYEVAWSHRLMDNRLQYGFNLFLIDGDNMIQVVSNKNQNTGWILNRGAEVQASWQVNKYLSLNTNHSYLYTMHNIVGAPKYKGYLGANAHVGKFSATVGLQQVSGLYTVVDTDNEDHMENFTLLNATLRYQALKQLSIWVKGDNLLCQKYEINAGFPMPRATFMGGVNISF